MSGAIMTGFLEPQSIEPSAVSKRRACVYRGSRGFGPIHADRGGVDGRCPLRMASGKDGAL